MKEYTKFAQKENILTLELQNIANRLELPTITNYKHIDYQDLKTQLRELETLIQHPVSLDIIKTRIHDFEGKLTQYKLDIVSKIAENALEEATLNLQVEKLHEIVKNHENPVEQMYFMPQKKINHPKNIIEEEEYLDFIQRHGSTGGWDSITHSTFLNLREKYGVVDLEHFYKVCLDRIPGMGFKDIQKHEEWYRKYSKLVNNRKKKIQEWKKLKNIQAERLLKDLENQENSSPKKSDVSSKKEVEKRKEIRKAVQEWKNSKLNNNQKVDKVEDDELKAKENEKREKVKEYVERKKQVENLEDELKAVSHLLEKREKELRYSIENKKFKKKDNEYLEKRRERLQKKESEQVEREKRLSHLISKVAIQVPKDPNRLMKPTIAQKFKAATLDDDSEKIKSKFEAVSIPKRYQPVPPILDHNKMTRIRQSPGRKPDPHPEVPAAGKTHNHSDQDSAKVCLEWNQREPYKKRSLLDPIQHMPQKVAANVAAVSEKARNLTHGVRGEYKHSAGDVVFPPKKNPLLQEREALRESMYHRREHQILGAAIPNTTKLPDFTMDPDFRFGMATHEDEDVRLIIHPPKNPESDNEKYKRQYILSHKSYGPGEHRMHYGPDWSVPETSYLKSQTRLDSDGTRVRESLYWDDLRQEYVFHQVIFRELKNKIISKRLADFRERIQPQLGKVHDPMKDTRAHLSSDHTFGIVIPPDEHTVGHLIGTGKKYTERIKYVPTTPAGIPTRHEHLESVKPHIPKLQECEDASLGFKITEDVRGGALNERMLRGFDLNHVFGIPSVRDKKKGPHRKRLADGINYGDELGAKGLIYATPVNIYGRDQLFELEKLLGSTSIA